MRESALAYLACPRCGGSINLNGEREDDGHVIEGILACTACSATYPVQRGVPRFVQLESGVESRTAEAFGYEWRKYREITPMYRKQFLDWIRPVPESFFRDRVVLEGGCGKGRHTALVAEFGARAIVAIDLGEAVDSAFMNTRGRENVHIVQADLNHPPVQRVFDYAFSIGVLHHLPDPERGFRAIASRLRHGGTISAWVYGREGNGWIVHLVTPVRRHITTRMPLRLLDWVSAVVTVPLFVATRAIYRPARGTALSRVLPYSPYLSYIADFPFREQHSIVFDHLLAPIAFYIKRDDFEQWFARAGMTDVVIEHHNGNSWRGCGRTNGAD